jgi:hypothetical protein
VDTNGNSFHYGDEIFYGSIIVIDSTTGEEKYRVNTDGTSYHAGLETFEGGIRIPTLFGGYVEIDEQGFAVVDTNGHRVFEVDEDGYSYHEKAEQYYDGIVIYMDENASAAVLIDSLGIRMLNESGQLVTHFLPDGTSFHSGLETFAGGIQIPTAEGGYINIDPIQGISIVGADGTIRGSWNTDGTSMHAGQETFTAGITVPLENFNQVSISPTGGIQILSPSGGIITSFYPDGTSFHGGTETFAQDVIINGTLFASEKNFQIDHPLDPDNQYLRHCSIESSERMNIYSGNVVTDDGGFAIVELPEYFEALNTDFRYQLTVIGSFARAMIKEEVHNNQFVIQTDTPLTKVSWEVSGIRQDKYALDHPLAVEVRK